MCMARMIEAPSLAGDGSGTELVDLIAGIGGGLPGGLSEVFAGACVEDGSGRVDHHAGPVCGPTRANRGFDITALSSDTRDQQRQCRRQLTHTRQLGGGGCTDDQAELPGAVPGPRGQSGDPLEEPLCADIEQLKVGAARVGGATEQEHATALVFKPRLD